MPPIEKARQFMKRVFGNAAFDPVAFETITSALAQVIADERENCARIAENAVIHLRSDDGQRIAKEIRES